MTKIIKILKLNNLISFIFSLVFLFSCSKKQHENIKEEKAITILVQPFKDIKSENVEYVVNEIKKIYPYVKILEPIDLPEMAYYKERKRYRADSIISFLSKKTEKGFVTIGLTSKDISTTKGKIKDFGVMGLGFTPGKSCIASSFRLNKKNSNEQFFKVAIHELGHTALSRKNVFYERCGR